ncbi:MAG TPA: asparagine synthetase B family protein [Acidiferrobacterales bacterium]|nr:asparagine synthetase B family protein [Acidiferrobacterales bacterium]
MWLEIDIVTFALRQEGLQTRALAASTLYTSPGLEALPSAKGLADAEYGFAIEVDARSREVVFGRDYLGHYPLFYACTNDGLLLSDDIHLIIDRLKRNGTTLTVSEEAVGFYFATGYIPQGMTLFREISACENASLYHWKNRRIVRESLFVPIEEDPNFSLAELGRCIEAEVARLARTSDQIDVWCSGGIDSSIMARCFNNNGWKADVLTLGYGEEITEIYGDGEIRFAQEMADACGVPLRFAELNGKSYAAIYDQFTKNHYGPVIDTDVLPKYVLASVTRDLAITGEGGDPLFSGAKNNTVLYAHERAAHVSLAAIYTAAHKRFDRRLEKILTHGQDLKLLVVEHFDKLLASFPGSLVRKLFYLNTFVKQGGLIFPNEYYAAKCYGVWSRHPLTSLSVYKAAFRLSDNKKYVYPTGKLALIELYKNQLPESIWRRKKSGTRVFLDYYVKQVVPGKVNLDILANTNLCNDSFLDEMINTNLGDTEPLLLHALLTLNTWLNRKGAEKNEYLSIKTGSYQQPTANA